MTYTCNVWRGIYILIHLNIVRAWSQVTGQHYHQLLMLVGVQVLYEILNTRLLIQVSWKLINRIRNRVILEIVLWFDFVTQWISMDLIALVNWMSMVFVMCTIRPLILLDIARIAKSRVPRLFNIIISKSKCNYAICINSIWLCA